MKNEIAMVMCICKCLERLEKR